MEYCCRSYFKSYFSVGFICTMAGNVVTGFGSTIPGVVLQRLPFIILSASPLVLCILLRKRIVTGVPDERSLLFVTAVSVVFWPLVRCWPTGGTYGDSYTYNFQTDAAVFSSACTRRCGWRRNTRCSARPSPSWSAGRAGGYAGRYVGGATAGGIR